MKAPRFHLGPLLCLRREGTLSKIVLRGIWLDVSVGFSTK